jgi:hypothetical protein
MSFKHGRWSLALLLHAAFAFIGLPQLFMLRPMASADANKSFAVRFPGNAILVQS